MIKSLSISGLLSFSNTSLELKPLNVIIGPNGAGKSNLIEIFALLKNLALSDISAAIRGGGTAADWLWKRDDNSSGQIEAILPSLQQDVPYVYKIELALAGNRLIIENESLTSKVSTDKPDDHFPFFDIHRGFGNIILTNDRLPPSGGDGKAVYRKIRVLLESKDAENGVSQLREVRGPQFPEITEVARFISSIQLYREWNLGRETLPRKPQPADAPSDFLEEKAGNLALVLNRLDREGALKKIEEELAYFYEKADRLSFQIEGGTAQIFLREKGLDKLIPATRLSDGTIRYLCLLAILLHPHPPSLVCLEEPELGLHPELISHLADLLKAASEKMQLIVTTHSDLLIDALSDTPESVVVCERSLADGGTIFKRLNQDQLSVWLEDYRLGKLWLNGEIGGTRW